MLILDIKMNVFLTKYSQIDLLIFSNCLNEVTYGFELKNFEDSIGDSLENTRKLFEKIHSVFSLSKKDSNSDQAVELEVQEVNIILNSIKAALCEFDYPGEFHTRVGADREEAEELIKQLESMV